MTDPHINQPQPMYLANQALNMGRNSEGRDAMLFNKIALVSMGVTALAAGSQVLLPAIERLFTLLWPHTTKEEHRRKKLTGRDQHER